MYDPARHSEFLPTGSHIGVPALGYGAWNLWDLGWPDSALARAEEAVSLGRRLNHPFSMVRALFFETNIHRFRRDCARQQERAAEVVALSETQGFPLFVGFGRYYYAAPRIVAGDVAGLRESLEALTLIRETGYQSPGMLYFLAETQQAGGQLAEAQATVAAALAISAQLGQPSMDVDLHRLDGDLVLATGGAPEEAAARYQQALDIARAQGAKSSSCAQPQASRGCGATRANVPLLGLLRAPLAVVPAKLVAFIDGERGNSHAGEAEVIGAIEVTGFRTRIGHNGQAELLGRALHRGIVRCALSPGDVHLFRNAERRNVVIVKRQ